MRGAAVNNFWAALGCAYVVALLFAAAQYFSVVDSTGDPASGVAFALPVLIAAGPFMVLISAIGAFHAGWFRREGFVRAQGEWIVATRALSTEMLTEELRRVSPTATENLSYGLNLSANSDGLAVWSGWRKPKLQMWIPWSTVGEITVMQMRGFPQDQPALAFYVQWGDAIAQLPFKLAGGFPFQSFPPGREQVVKLLADLDELRLRARSGHVERQPLRPL
jgi:hypothetical protein